MTLDNLPHDPASMRLAHPFRTQAFSGEGPALLRKMTGEKEWAKFVEILRDDSIMAGAIVEVIQQRGLRTFEKLVYASTQASSSTELGGAMPFLVALRHQEVPYPIFRVDDALVDILSKTDISDDISVSMLPLPYPRLYVELGQSRTLKEVLSNAETGQHILEGAYIEKGVDARRGEGYYIMLTGSPLGKNDVMDDATLAFFLPTATGEERLQDILLKSVNYANKEAQSKGLRTTPVEWTEECFRALLLLIKALLYISLPESRREVHPERTEALKELQRIKSGSKRAKAERRLVRLADFVTVKAAPVHEKAFSEHASREGGVKPHWRRAHYRMQAHGPHMSLRKLIFVTEMLVGAGDHPDAPVVKDYVVR
jgi:hypothetical protein